MSVLYICYQSLFDPLTQTQVVAYLEGLASENEPIVLLTFEPTEPSSTDVALREKQLLHQGIVWRRLKYHKRPTLPATMWDILIGTYTARCLIQQHDIQLVHARSHVPAMIGRLLKRWTGVKLLFDVRGLLAEEYVDAGVWPVNGGLFRLTKRAERKLMAAADAFVVLTERARELLTEWYPHELDGKPITVIPCCAELTASGLDRVDGPESRIGDQQLTIVYAGKLDGWYLTDEMVDFFTYVAAADRHVNWDIWTQGPTQRIRAMVRDRGFADRVQIGSTSPQQLKRELLAADAGLAFIRPCLSKQASSPTKVAEYLAAGIPVISTAGVGDLDAVLRGDFSFDGQPVGILVEAHTATAYADALTHLRKLHEDPLTPARCRDVARRLFDLKTVGWTRYRRVYADLGIHCTSPPQTSSTVLTDDAQSLNSNHAHMDDRTFARFTHK